MVKIFLSEDHNFYQRADIYKWDTHDETMNASDNGNQKCNKAISLLIASMLLVWLAYNNIYYLSDFTPKHKRKQANFPQYKNNQASHSLTVKSKKSLLTDLEKFKKKIRSKQFFVRLSRHQQILIISFN